MNKKDHSPYSFDIGIVFNLQGNYILLTVTYI